jgi:hypothetical protein
VAFGVTVQPCMGLVSFLVPKGEVVARVDGEEFSLTPRPRHCEERSDAAIQTVSAMVTGLPRFARNDDEGEMRLTIQHLAYARSGEKGETINIGIIARAPDYLPLLRAALTEEALKTHLPDLGDFRVTIYEVPGIHALNLVLAGALPGGLNASQRFDPAAKSIGQRLMRFPI